MIGVIVALLTLTALVLGAGAILVHVLATSESITASELMSLLDARRMEINRLEAKGVLDRLVASMLRNASPRITREDRS